MHRDSGELCDLESWRGRGWCRLEEWSNYLSVHQMNPLVITEAGVAVEDLPDFFAFRTSSRFNSQNYEFFGLPLCDYSISIVCVCGCLISRLRHFTKNIHSTLSTVCQLFFCVSAINNIIESKNQEPGEVKCAEIVNFLYKCCTTWTPSILRTLAHRASFC